MLNKNIVIILVFGVLVVGGLFYFFNSGFSNSPSPVNTKGELTRELARKLILDYYAKEFDEQNITSVTYLEAVDSYMSFGIVGKALEQLIDKGLISRRNKFNDYFTFTSAAAPYLLETDNPTYPANKRILLGESELKGITITGITMESDNNALVKFDADTAYTYTPFGEVLSEQQAPRRTESGAIPFTLYDDGWRVDFLRYIK